MALTQIKGTPSINWGVINIAGGNIPSGAIVESLELTPKNGEPIEIEDSAGLAVNEILLRDGFNAKVSAIYDNNKVWPIEGANANLALPFNNATANAIPFGESTSNTGSVVTGNGNTAIVTYTCLVASISPAFKKKGEEMITLNLTYRPQVAV
jgi:hypothetical protein